MSVAHPFSVLDAMPDFSDLLSARCRLCPQKAEYLLAVRFTEEMYGRLEVCSGCKFRHTVAKAAGREYELLAGLYKSVQKPEYPEMVRNVTIGQFADFVDFSDLFDEWTCCCGQNPAVEQIGKYALCESCRFQYLVMRAAGREKEFAGRMKNGG